MRTVGLLSATAIVVTAAVVLAGLALGREPDDALVQAAASGVTVALLVPLVGAMTGRRIVRDKRRGHLEVSLRVGSGELPGLGTGWQAGELDVRGRPQSFTPLRGGVRLLRGRPLSIEITAVRRTDRTTPARAAWSVLPGMPILELETPTARLDLAVPAGSESWVDEMVRSTGR